MPTYRFLFCLFRVTDSISVIRLLFSMARKANLKCAKCGLTSDENPTLTFHRFPLPSRKNGSLKAKVWAKYCYPNEDWTSDKSLRSLHLQKKMLCGNHFDDAAYTNNDRKRLNMYCIPVEAQNILTQMRTEQCKRLRETQTTKNQESTVEMDVEPDSLKDRLSSTGESD